MESSEKMDALLREGVSDVIARTFGWDSYVRGRLFLCCISGGEMMVLTDDRKGRGSEERIYRNVFVPTVCGWCEKDEGGPATVEGKGGLELSTSLLKDWRVYKMVEAWCGSEVETVMEVSDRKKVMETVRGYWIAMRGAETFGKELKMLTYVTPGFL